MSKKEYNKYKEEFKKRSARIPWVYYKKILEEEYGAVENKRSHSAGSKRSYTIGKDIVFVIDEPHKKDRYVGKWYHHKIHDLFTLHGLFENEKE